MSYVVGAVPYLMRRSALLQKESVVRDATARPSVEAEAAPTIEVTPAVQTAVAQATGVPVSTVTADDVVSAALKGKLPSDLTAGAPGVDEGLGFFGLLGIGLVAVVAWRYIK